MLVTIFNLIDDSPKIGSVVNGLTTDTFGQVTLAMPGTVTVDGIPILQVDATVNDVSIWMDNGIAVPQITAALVIYGPPVLPMIMSEEMPVPVPPPPLFPVPPAQPLHLPMFLSLTLFPLGEPKAMLQQETASRARRAGRRSGRPELLGD